MPYTRGELMDYLTDEETKAVLILVREARNHHDDEYKRLGAAYANPSASWWELRQHHKDQSKLLTGILVKAYQQASNEIGETGGE